MPIPQPQWYSVSPADSSQLRCGNCQRVIDMSIPSLDHHPCWCPACGVECLLYTPSNSHLQILVQQAPAEVQMAIRWAQEELDEVEFLELLGHVSGLIQTIDSRKTSLLSVARPLDLRGYDWEYGRLVSAQWKKPIHEIEFSLVSPASSWHYKEKYVKAMQAVGLKKWVTNPATKFELSLRFLGVSEIVANLSGELEKIQTTEHIWQTIEATEFDGEIQDIRNVKLPDDGWRFYLHCANLQLEFSYQDCIHLEKATN